MSELSIPEYVSVAVHDIAKAKGFQEPSLVWKNGMNVGDGFTGRIFRVIISEACPDGNSDSQQQKDLTLIVKLPPEQPDYRKMAMLMFDREIRIYNKILPTLKQFQEEHNLTDADGFFAFPHCHSAHFDAERDEAYIILDDLREKGYAMENKYEVIGVDQAKMVIRAIAKYHGTSIALKHKNPTLFAPFKELDDFFKSNFPEEMMVQMNAGNVANAMKSLQKSTDTMYREKLEQFRDKILEINESIWDAEPLAVPIHGDCWTNNFMFKYEVRNVR